MNFYAIKEHYHSAVFDDEKAAEQFKINVGSKAKVMRFVSLAEVWKYLNWKVNNTEVFISEADSYSAIYENKSDADSGMKFNGPYQASTYLDWEKTNLLVDEENELGKSRIYKHLLEYTYNECGELLKVDRKYWLLVFVTFLFFVHVLAVIIKLGFYAYEKRNIPNWFMPWSWFILILVSVVFLFLYNECESNSFISTRDGAIKQISSGIYREIRKYHLSTVSLVELIKETYEINKKIGFNKNSKSLMRKIVETTIVPAIITFLIQQNLTKIQQNLILIQQNSYERVTIILFSIPVILTGCAFFFVARVMLSDAKMYYRKNYEVSSLLLRQELKNILLERI